MKKATPALILTVSLLLILNFTGCSKSKKISVPEKKAQVQKIEVPDDEAIKKTVNNLYTVEAEPFPDFSEYPQFDALFRNECNQIFSDFEKECSENLEAAKQEDSNFSTEEAFGYFSRNFTVAQKGPGYISVAVLYRMITGIGPSSAFYKTYYWSVKEEQLLGLAAVLPYLGEHATLETLSHLCYENLVEQLSRQNAFDDNVEEMVREGTDPIQENYSAFTISSDKLSVYFSKYQVAPGVYDVFVVDLDIRELKFPGDE